MAEYTEAKKVQVFATPGWFIVRAPRDDGFAEDLRELPYYDRKFCYTIGAWAIREAHKKVLIVSLKKRYSLKKVAIN